MNTLYLIWDVIQLDEYGRKPRSKNQDKWIKMKYDFPNKFKIKNAHWLAIAFLMTASLFVFVTPMQPAAAVTVAWEFSSFGCPPGTCGYTMGDGGIGSPQSIQFNVFDDTVACTPGNAIPETRNVSVSSTSGDVISLTLNEVDGAFPPTLDPDSCIFGNTNLVFMADEQRVPIGSTVTVVQTDTSGGKDSNNLLDVITIKVNSTSTPSGIPLNLTETGNNTGFFTGRLMFTSGSSVDYSAIHVDPGNIISLGYLGRVSNGLITTNPDASIGAIIADIGDTITVTFLTVTDTTEVLLGGDPGGGGGGLIRPGVVFDVILAGGQGGADRSPPSFTLSRSSLTGLSLPDMILNVVFQANPFDPLMPINDHSIDVPLWIGDNGYALFGYSQTIETATVETGTTAPIELSLNDASGIEHIALYTNVGGAGGEIQNSDTYIIYDEDKPLQVTDPHGLFSDVKLTSSKEGINEKFLFNIMFAKPMDTSDIIFRIWDEKRNSADTKIFDAIKVVGEPVVEHGVDSFAYTEMKDTLIPYYKFPQYIIPAADHDGIIIYYNSFGELEQKQVHSNHGPTIYPDNLGRSERHDKGFQETIIQEAIKAQTLAERLIGNPFITLEDRPAHQTFFYSTTVGKLDRKNIDTLNDVVIKELDKATKYYDQHYRTNHIED